MSEGKEVFAELGSTLARLEDHVGRVDHEGAVQNGWGHIHEEATKHLGMARSHLTEALGLRRNNKGYDSLPHVANAAAILHHVNTQLNMHSTSPYGIGHTADLKLRAGRLASQSGKVQ